MGRRVALLLILTFKPTVVPCSVKIAIVLHGDNVAVTFVDEAARSIA